MDISHCLRIFRPSWKAANRKATKQAPIRAEKKSELAYRRTEKFMMVARKAPPCGQLWGNLVPRVSLLCFHCLFSTTMEAEKRDPGNEVDCGVGMKRVQGSHFYKRKAERDKAVL